MTILTKNLNNKNLQLVGVSGVDKATCVTLRNMFVAGYKIVATYSGNVASDFQCPRTVKHGARVMQADYNKQQNTTAVTYFFDNRDCLNAEDAHYRANMFRNELFARVKTK